MEFCEAIKPNTSESLGLLGYLVIANNQIHSHQMDVLIDYVTSKGLSIEESVINDILNGIDTAVTYACSLSAFSEETPEFQSEFILAMYIISYVDNLLDSREEEIINNAVSKTTFDIVTIHQIIDRAKVEAEHIRESKNVIFRRSITDEKNSIFKRLISWLIRIIRKLFHVTPIVSKEDDDYFYAHAIEKCAEIAKEDFLIVKPAYEKVLDACTQTINKIQAHKNSLSRDTIYAEGVVDAISVFTERLNEDVLEQTKNAQRSLVQKERTVSDFTISLLGRTKAGKSTLHAILTNQGRSRIGSGKQRTTRCNYVYQWNLLRIIDTPGIGSAEAAGRSDDEIAASVLGESDVICFVVVDDSILKDILEFIEKIALLNKPIIVLLNHKENIKPEVKFKRFIANPMEWLTTQGESNLQGHINRIVKYANDRGFGSLISVCPVFLLPALMSTEPEYREHSNCLWESSNIDIFIEKLKTWITKGGTIKRSQTILDEVSKNFSESNYRILQAENVLREQIVKLDSQRVKKTDKLREEAAIVIERIRKILEENYIELATNEALAFAEEEYGKKGNVSEDWAAYVKRKNFEQMLRDEIDKELNEYREQIKDVVNDLFEDYYFSVNSTFKAQNISLPLNINFRGIARLGGAAIGAVGGIILVVLGASNPVGWILTGLGVAVELFSNLFKTKEKKRQEFINRIYNSIHDSIMNAMESEIETILKELNKGIQKNIDDVDTLFTDLRNGLSKTAEISMQLRKSYSIQEHYLNKAYGCRITQFATGRYNPLNGQTIDNLVSEVDRSVKGEITITTNQKMPKEIYDFDGIIAEKIRFL